MTDKAAKPKRKKSEKRQRDKQIKFRCLTEEFNDISAGAAKAGLTVGAWLRALARSGDPGARAQRNTTTSLDLGLVKKLIGQLGYYGNNINQTAYELHAFGEKGLAQDFAGRKAEIDEIIEYLLDLIGKPPRPKTA
jgi:hypothetical protein